MYNTRHYRNKHITQTECLHGSLDLLFVVCCAFGNVSLVDSAVVSRTGGLEKLIYEARQRMSEKKAFLWGLPGEQKRAPPPRKLFGTEGQLRQMTDDAATRLELGPQSQCEIRYVWYPMPKVYTLLKRCVSLLKHLFGAYVLPEHYQCRSSRLNTSQNPMHMHTTGVSERNGLVNGCPVEETTIDTVLGACGLAWHDSLK